MSAPAPPPTSSPAVRPRPRILPALLALALVGVVCLLLIEGTLSLWRNLISPDQFHVWPPDTEQSFEPSPEFVPGISDTSRVAFNSLGMRGGHPPPASSDGPPALRILAVGGSTTECLYLDQAETWAHGLESGLAAATGRPVHVGNVGKSGINTREHVLQLQTLLPQHPEFGLVVSLVGVNDMMLPVCEIETYKPGALDDPARRARLLIRSFALVPRTVTAAAEKQHAFHRRLATFDLLRRFKWAKIDAEQDIDGSWMAPLREYRRAATPVDVLPDLGPGLGEFQDNLGRMIDACADEGRQLVLLTQPYLWAEDMPAEQEELLWFGGIGDFLRDRCDEYYTPRALAEAMEAYNSALLAICAERGTPCFDLANAIGRDPSCFYDDVHFTEHGAQRVAELIAPFIAEQL